MRSLFFKIFIIFWIAQSLIFVISTSLILNRRIPRPVFLSPIFEDLRSDSLNAVAAFEAQGCAGLTEYARTRKYGMALKDDAGHTLCSSGEVPAVDLRTRTNSRESKWASIACGRRRCRVQGRSTST